MSDRPLILEFKDLTAEPGAGDESGIWRVSFTLRAAELMLVRLEHSAARLPLADAAVGLATISSGTVLFEGNSGTTESPKTQPERAAASVDFSPTEDGSAR